MTEHEEPPAGGAVTQAPTKEYQPLGKKAAAVAPALTFTTCIAANTWQNIAVLTQGATHTSQELIALDALYWTTFVLAAWAVIRWADAAQDNLQSLKNPPLKDRLEWYEWCLPILNISAPYFGVAHLSRGSNPHYNPATGEGTTLASILPWWLLWASAVTTGILVPIGIHLAGASSDSLDA